MFGRIKNKLKAEKERLKGLLLCSWLGHEPDLAYGWFDQDDEETYWYYAVCFRCGVTEKQFELGPEWEAVQRDVEEKLQEMDSSEQCPACGDVEDCGPTHCSWPGHLEFIDREQESSY